MFGWTRCGIYLRTKIADISRAMLRAAMLARMVACPLFAHSPSSPSTHPSLAQSRRHRALAGSTLTSQRVRFGVGIRALRASPLAPPARSGRGRCSTSRPAGGTRSPAWPRMSAALPSTWPSTTGSTRQTTWTLRPRVLADRTGGWRGLAAQ